MAPTVTAPSTSTTPTADTSIADLGSATLPASEADQILELMSQSLTAKETPVTPTAEAAETADGTTPAASGAPAAASSPAEGAAPAEGTATAEKTTPPVDAATPAPAKMTERELELIVENIHDAVDHNSWGFLPYGTDEKGLIESLKGYTKEEMEQIKLKYSDKHGESLESRLQAELSFGDQEIALAYLDGDTSGAATEIYYAMHMTGNYTGLGWTDTDKIAKILNKFDDPQKLYELEKEFNSRYTPSLRSMFDSEMDGDVYNESIELLDRGRNIRAEKEGTAAYLKESPASEAETSTATTEAEAEEAPAADTPSAEPAADSVAPDSDEGTIRFASNSQKADSPTAGAAAPEVSEDASLEAIKKLEYANTPDLHMRKSALETASPLMKTVRLYEIARNSGSPEDIAALKEEISKQGEDTLKAWYNKAKKWDVENKSQMAGLSEDEQQKIIAQRREFQADVMELFKSPDALNAGHIAVAAAGLTKDQFDERVAKLELAQPSQDKVEVADRVAVKAKSAATDADYVTAA